MVLRRLLPSFKAQDLLDDPTFTDDLTAEGMYNLTLRATGDKEQARQAMSRHAAALMERGIKP